MAGLVLVTGGSGYFGSLLVRKLVAQGRRCRVFDLVDADDRPEGVEFVQGDIRDFEQIRQACIGVETIHHNVAQVPVAKSRRLFEEVNIGGTENLLRAAVEAGVRKVVYTSSSAVYGVPPYNPVTESTPPRPREAYGRAKLEGERLCRRYRERGLDVTIVRPRTVLGHGRLGIFQILFEWVYQGYNIPVLGRGDNRYQFIHADDLAEACLKAAEREGGDAYNVGASRFGTMREMLEALCRHAGTGSKVRSVPAGAAVAAMRITSALGWSPLGAYHALMYGRSMYFDIGKAVRELQWQPRYSNDEMIVESYDWYVQHRQEVLRGKEASAHRSKLREGALKLVRALL